MSEPFVHYALDPTAKFPKRWQDYISTLRVICEPHEGWVMVRRPGCKPFVLHVSDLCNATRHAPHGPFTLVTKAPPTTRGVREP